MYRLKRSLVIFNDRVVYDYQDDSKRKLKQIVGSTGACYAAVHLAAEDDDDGSDCERCPCETYGDSRYCEFFKDGEYLYTLRRMPRYLSDECLVEFVTCGRDGRVLFIFNKSWMAIAVCDAETGRVLHQIKPEFELAGSYKRMDERWLYLEQTRWYDKQFQALVDLDALVAGSDYQPYKLQSTKGTFTLMEDGKRLQDRGQGQSFEPQEIVARESEIVALIKQADLRQFKAHRNGDSVLPLLLLGGRAEDPSRIQFSDRFARARLQELLTAEDITSLRIECMDKESGSLSPKHECSLFTHMLYHDSSEDDSSIQRQHICRTDTLQKLMPKVLFGDRNCDGSVYGLRFTKQRAPGIHFQWRFFFKQTGSIKEKMVCIDVDQQLEQATSSSAESEVEGAESPEVDIYYCASDDLPLQVVITAPPVHGDEI